MFGARNACGGNRKTDGKMREKKRAPFDGSGVPPRAYRGRHLPEGEPLSWSALPKTGSVGGPANVRNAAMNLRRRRAASAISETATHIRINVLTATMSAAAADGVNGGRARDDGAGVRERVRVARARGLTRRRAGCRRVLGVSLGPERAAAAEVAAATAAAGGGGGGERNDRDGIGCRAKTATRMVHVRTRCERGGVAGMRAGTRARAAV